MAETNELIIHADGGARGNPGPAAIGAVIKNNQNQVLARISQTVGNKTNNEAEYLAVIAVLKQVSDKKLQPQKILLNVDSQLIYHQLSGSYKVKKEHLQKLLWEIRTLENSLNCPIFYKLIPREQNRAADALVNQALDSLLK